MKKVKVGIIGIRGYQVIYSGFETLVNNLVKNKNNNCFYYLFSRSGYKNQSKEGKNFKNIIIPIFNGKYFETPVYAFFSTLYSLFLPLETILYLSVANAPVLFLQKLRRRKIIVNVDGLDWKRSRWSSIGKAYLKLCEFISVKFADVIIADSKSVFNYYKKTHKLENVHYIAYGADVKNRKPGRTLNKFNLKKDKYFLFVGRIVPENKIDDLIRAFKTLNTTHKCVIVGDAFFENNYKKKIINLSHSYKRIVLTGILEGKDYEEVCSNAFCYVETKSAGGTHPSLLEAMAFGRCIIARDVPEHKEALLSTGIYFNNKNSTKDLKKKMTYVLMNPSETQKLGKLSKERVKKHFRWKNVIRKYLILFSAKT